ncbi:MAG: GHKL domain-containing protein [Oscillospiraceae bacterium]|nr:GHKL domain-containing protein [Oscillospiraceae bacterium]
MQIAQKQEEMKNLDKQYQEISVIRHDFKNQVNTIQELLQQEKIQEALHFIATITDRSFYSVHQIVKSNSSVFNAVINTRFNEAKKHQIIPSCRIVSEIPEYFEYELGILLSNLLDNAIEACQKQNTENQLLIVSFSETGGYYRLVVKNTIGKSVLKYNHHLKTSKSDKSMHGWGLKSVSDIVEAHRGLLDFYEKDSFFIVNVMLPIKGKKLPLGA